MLPRAHTSHSHMRTRSATRRAVRVPLHLSRDCQQAGGARGLARAECPETAATVVTVSLSAAAAAAKAALGHRIRRGDSASRLHVATAFGRASQTRPTETA